MARWTACLLAENERRRCEKKVGRSKRTAEICHCRENTSLRHPITIIFQSVQKDSAAALLHLNGCAISWQRENQRVSRHTQRSRRRKTAFNVFALWCMTFVSAFYRIYILTKQGALARPASLRVWPLDGRCTWRPSNCYIYTCVCERASERSVRERWSINGTQM